MECYCCSRLGHTIGESAIYPLHDFANIWVSIIKHDPRLLEGALHVFREACPSILNMLTPIGEHLLQDLMNLHETDKDGTLYIQQLDVRMANEFSGTIEFVAQQIENLYGESSRAQQHVEESSQEE